MPLQRVLCECEHLCDRFSLSEASTFKRQYYSLYLHRLHQARTNLIKVAKQKYGNDVKVKTSLSDLVESEQCVTVGTVYKVQAFKPSVIKEVALQVRVRPQPVFSISKFADKNDKVLIEDEELRVPLTGSIDFGHLCTGIVIAVYGQLTTSSNFEVVDVMFPFVDDPIYRPAMLTDVDEPLYVLVVSGLSFDAREGDNVKGQILCNLLFNWIMGNFGNEEEVDKASRIARVIIAGNSVVAKGYEGHNRFNQVAKYLSKKAVNPGVEAVSKLDVFLEQLSEFVPIDIMPGEGDPANYTLPQQPLHRCLFPKASRHDTFHRVTNPYHASINDVDILGTSGQNVDDVYRYSFLEDRIDIMKCILKWGHLCPTAPDTTDCYPYSNDDPFILSRLPNIFFASNQPSFATAYYSSHEDSKGVNDCLLLTVPSFSKTGCAVLIDLTKLTAEPIVFDFDVYDGSEDNEELVHPSVTP